MTVITIRSRIRLTSVWTGKVALGMEASDVIHRYHTVSLESYVTLWQIIPDTPADKYEQPAFGKPFTLTLFGDN
ncbi:MAG: hypothetical protein OXU68_04235 [Bacteroidota bacterium]|nr:hypothetical protein [Bacteroidota bacterium]